MKKLFTYIAMFAAAVSCQDMYGPEQTPIKPVASEGIEVSVLNVGDNDVTFVLAPKGEATYYSYLVDMSETAEALDSAAVLACSYEGVAAGTIKWTAAAPKDTVTVSKLASNATYQIYAVAGSSMGIPSAVVNISFKTSDKVAPSYTNIVAEGNVITVSVSENVTYNANSTPIKIAYYAYYSADFQTAAKPAGEVTVPADAIVVSGNEVVITVPEIPTGSYYTMNIPKGAFVDVVGLELPAYASSFVVVQTEEGPAVSPKGVYGEIDYVELPMFGAVEIESIDNWKAGIVVPLVNQYPIANYSSKNFVKVTYQTATASSTTTTDYTLAPKTTYGITASGFMVMLPEEPANGTTITVTIPTGCIYDIFGNDSEAFEFTTKYVSGYSLADIIGSYIANETSVYDGKPYPQALTIAESDNPEKGNVMFTQYWDMPCQIPIYATFDLNTGVLTIAPQQIFAGVKIASGPVYAMFSGADIQGGQVVPTEAPVKWMLDGPNMIIGPDYYYGVFAVDPTTFAVLGNFDAYYDIQATLATTAGIAPASVPAPRMIRTDKVNFTL